MCTQFNSHLILLRFSLWRVCYCPTLCWWLFIGLACPQLPLPLFFFSSLCSSSYVHPIFLVLPPSLSLFFVFALFLRSLIFVFPLSFFCVSPLVSEEYYWCASCLWLRSFSRSLPRSPTLSFFLSLPLGCIPSIPSTSSPLPPQRPSSVLTLLMIYWPTFSVPSWHRQSIQASENITRQNPALTKLPGQTPSTLNIYVNNLIKNCKNTYNADTDWFFFFLNKYLLARVKQIP